MPPDDGQPGTPLASDSVVVRSLPEAWRTSRSRLFLEEARPTTRVTIAAGFAVQAAFFALLAHAGYPMWRIGLVAAFYIAFAIGHRVVLRSAERGPAQVDTAFIWMNVLAQLYVVGSAAITGGVYSPFVPGTVLPAIVSLLFFGPYAVSRWMAVGNGLLIVAMVCLPRAVVGPALPSAEFTIGIVIGLVWNLFMLHLMVGKLSSISYRTGASMDCLREDRLAEAEAQLRRLQSVGAKVAHELKNPLASIKGLCQLVARAPEAERTQERLAVVASEIARMETILNEYLSFSRPLEDLAPVPLDLAALAREVIDVLSGRAEHAGIALELDGGTTQVIGDPRRLKEALINLVANAIEATPSGGRVRLRVRPGVGGVTLEVEDTGRGIAPDDLGRLGTSFFTTRPGGTGLGVVLAQGVIAQHGGRLEYASTVGRGTTATITLPVQPRVAPEPGARAGMVEARAT